ncbi:MAG: hypothetical protein Q9191_004120 [Dirinaria sp. TL-2023a]
MSEPKPTLKLKLSTGPKKPPSPIPETPSTATKLKLKLKQPSAAEASTTNPGTSSTTKTKAPRKSQKDKPVRASNPTAKKRALEASNLSDGDDDLAEAAIQPLKKKPTIKFIQKSSRPSIGVSTTGVPLSASNPSAPLSAGPSKLKITRKSTKGPKLTTYKPQGAGYDSCASDAESDPAIEEDFILRMHPGDDCEYLRQAIAEQRFGPKSDGGADIGMTFLNTDGRRAVVKIRGTLYAAAMVDLPCIIEGMKSWDKKGWYKSVDICQMLLVLGTIKSEDEALTYPLPPREVDPKTWQYAHGLTPPMHRVRKRRFRKRVSMTTIEAVESQVDELLRRDAEAIESSYVVHDTSRLTQEQSVRSVSEGATQDSPGIGEQDAEGEEDDTQQYDEGATGEEALDDGFAEEFELAMMEDGDGDADVGPATVINEGLTSTPSIAPDSCTFAPSPGSAMGETPAATTPSKGATSGDDESSDADAESENAAEVDEDMLEQQQDLQRQRAEILDLENAIKTQQAEFERQQNPIFKRKLMSKIQSLQAELDLRKGAAGEGEDDGEE